MIRSFFLCSTRFHFKVYDLMHVSQDCFTPSWKLFLCRNRLYLYENSFWQISHEYFTPSWTLCWCQQYGTPLSKLLIALFTGVLHSIVNTLLMYLLIILRSELLIANFTGKLHSIVNTLLMYTDENLERERKNILNQKYTISEITEIGSSLKIFGVSILETSTIVFSKNRSTSIIGNNSR